MMKGLKTEHIQYFYYASMDKWKRKIASLSNREKGVPRENLTIKTLKDNVSVICPHCVFTFPLIARLIPSSHKTIETMKVLHGI